MSDLRSKALTGVVWSLFTQISRQGLRQLTTIILARLLSPDDFGLIAMVLVFSGFVALFGEMGFGAALVQHEEVSEQHFSSIFWLNIVFGMVSTLTLATLAPSIALFYGEPRLQLLIQVISLVFLIQAPSIVQSARLVRDMNFRLLAKIEIVSVLISSLFAVVLAVSGFGVWSLVWQIIISNLITIIGLWFTSVWRPRLILDLYAVKDLLYFSGHLFGFNVTNYWVRQGDNLLVGRFLGTAALGIYSQAYSLMLLPIGQVTAILSRVMFPVLSQLQHDKLRAKAVYLRSISMISLITFPMMLGLFAVADHFVLAVLGSQWQEVIPLLRIFSILGMIQSISTTQGWIYQSQGRTDWFFLWAVASGIVMFGGFIVGVLIGTAQAVALSFALTNGLILLYPGFKIPGRLINLEVREIVRSVSGPFWAAIVMTLFVLSLGSILPLGESALFYLTIQVLAGFIVYWFLVHIFHIESYEEIKLLVISYIERRYTRL